MHLTCIIQLTLLLLTVSIPLKAANITDPNSLNRKCAGLLYGSLLGDALGGPIEFQNNDDIQKLAQPNKLWKAGEKLTAKELKLAAERLVLRDYRPLRPNVEPYGQWTFEPGAVTDDSRHKMILLQQLRESETLQAWPIDATTLARTYLKWPTNSTKERYTTETAEWLNETYRSIHWLLGSRDLTKASPVERLWNGVPTSYGQMTLLPLAAIYPGEAAKAYKAAYDLAFFDNSWGRDMNAALVAGLSEALSIDMKQCGKEEAWKRIYKSMTEHDPYGYGKIPWMERSVDFWLRQAHEMVQRAAGEPAKLFDDFQTTFAPNQKWEAQVPFVVTFAVLELCDYDPLSALSLSMEWGWDHDSYGQLLGAFIGALYGPELFDPQQRKQVSEQLQADYAEDIEEWCSVLDRVRETARKQEIVTNKHKH